MITCIIAEKPSVARDIARIVGANSKQDGYMEGCGYVVTWAMVWLLDKTLSIVQSLYEKTCC